MLHKLLLALLLVATVAPASHGGKRPPRCGDLVVIAPGRGATGRQLARLVADATGPGLPYLPMGQADLEASDPNDRVSSRFPIAPSTVRSMNGYVFYFPGTGEPFRCTWVSRDATEFELADLIGRKVFYKLRGATYRRVPREQTSRGLTAMLDPDDYVKRDFVVPPDRRAFARTLALRQLRHSNTWQRATAARPAIEAAQTKMNQELLEILEGGENVSPAALQGWAKALLDADPLDDPDAQRSYWVIRGTQHEYQDGAVTVRVDLGGAGFTGAGVTPDRYFQAYRADDVPRELALTLRRINALDPRSSFYTASSAGHRYLRVFPTIKTNGRVGRAIVDFSLMRAGYPPAFHEDAESQPPFFVTEREVAENLLRAYRR